jgi:hypothetical protein
MEEYNGYPEWLWEDADPADPASVKAVRFLQDRYPETFSVELVGDACAEGTWNKDYTQSADLEDQRELMNKMQDTGLIYRAVLERVLDREDSPIEKRETDDVVIYRATEGSE